MTPESYPPRRHRSYLWRSLLMAAGVIIVLLGCCVILYIYAFSSMVDPRLIGLERCTLIFQKMLLTLNVIPVSIGAILVISGFSLMVVGGRGGAKPIGTQQSSYLLITIVLTICAVFLLSLIAFFM